MVTKEDVLGTLKKIEDGESTDSESEASSIRAQVLIRSMQESADMDAERIRGLEASLKVALNEKRMVEEASLLIRRKLNTITNGTTHAEIVRLKEELARQVERTKQRDSAMRSQANDWTAFRVWAGVLRDHLGAEKENKRLRKKIKKLKRRARR